MASSYVVTKEINENHMAICCSKGISADTSQPTLPFPELQMESTSACFHSTFFPPQKTLPLSRSNHYMIDVAICLMCEY